MKGNIILFNSVNMVDNKIQESRATHLLLASNIKLAKKQRKNNSRCIVVTSNNE